MDFRSTPCVFLGYSPSHHGYRCLDISTERLYIARHVKTDKNGASFLQIKIVPKVIPILLLKLSQMLTAGIPDNQKKLIQGSMPDTVADVNMLQDLLIMRAWNPFIFNSYTMV
ncbi:hypothetical protein Tco_0266349 [Tanacetum coccineum]